MGVTQKNFFVLSKMVHVSKKSGNKSCKITYFDPTNYIISKKESKFEGFIPSESYIDLNLMDKVNVGTENTFDFGVSDYGTTLKIIDVLG